MQPATGVILCCEKSGDKLEVADDEDLHSSDTVQEKLSLVYRFGVRIYYGAPGKKEFQTIVRALAERNGIKMPEDKLLLEANKWELSHGGLTGRTCTAVYRSSAWCCRRIGIRVLVSYRKQLSGRKAAGENTKSK